MFKVIVNELHEKNKNGLFTKLMMESTEHAPKLPQINRNCWELAFKSSNHYDAIKRFIKDKYKTRKNKIPVTQFKKDLFSVFDPKIWNQGSTLEDTLYCFKSNKVLELINKGDNITHLFIN